MTYEYKLTRSKRKTLAISIKPDCSIEVKAPLKTSNKEIERFIHTHNTWIEKNLQIMRTRKEERDALRIDYGTQVCFFGKRIPIVAADIKKAKLDDNCVLMPKNLDEDSIKKLLIVLYKTTAKDYIASELPQISRQIGVSPSKLTITSARTNWGSCTADRLHFSWHLIMAEKEVIDYVIIHELVHIIHHNHSDKFWREVSKHCPQWKTLRARLKIYSEIIARENW